MLRIYDWAPNENPAAAGQPFVEPEITDTLGPYPHHLIAGDGHRLPFPLDILRTRQYYRSTHCRVRLFAQSDLEGRRPGIDYFMEIHLAGRSHVVDQAAEVADNLGIIVPTSGSGLALGLAGAVGLSACTLATAISAGAATLLAPNPNMSGERIWQRRVHLTTGTVTLQYEYLP
jgi:hypothetical protein